MSNLRLMNDKEILNFSDREYTLEDVNYLNKRLLYLERVIKSKYSDILYLASEICNLKNVNLKYDLVDILVKHGSNLSRYKEELVDIKDMLDAFGNNQSQVQERIEEDEKVDNQLNNTKNEKPHNFDYNNENPENSNSNEKEIVNEFSDTEISQKDVQDEPVRSEKNNKHSLTKNLKLKNLKIVGSSDVQKKSKSDIAREKILNNLDKLISYKENTFNDLIEMVGFHNDSNSQKTDLSKFIECLESQIVELNEYKNNILKNYSLSKSIEIGSNGKITFSRVFIEKERLMDKDKDNYIKVLTEMHELYTKFVDNYLKNINYMKPYLDSDKINLMQSNCSKVIYDLKIIKNLYSSLEKSKGM